MTGSDTVSRSRPRHSTHIQQRKAATMGLFDLLKKKKPAMPETIEEGMASQATDFVGAFSRPGAPIEGSRLDYTASSLSLVDQVLDDFFKQRAPLPDDLHFLASAYVFEVARREFGGRYLRGDEDEPLRSGDRPGRRPGRRMRDGQGARACSQRPRGRPGLLLRRHRTRRSARCERYAHLRTALVATMTAAKHGHSRLLPAAPTSFE